MISVSDTIQTLVAQIANSVYLRATDYEANIEVDNLDLVGKIIFIYNNLPIINYEIDVAVSPQWPINIKVLQLVDLDANTSDKDAIREAMVIPAQTLLKALLNDSISSQATLPPNATIEFLDNEFDKGMTGVELEFELQMNTIC